MKSTHGEEPPVVHTCVILIVRILVHACCCVFNVYEPFHILVISEYV